jgi:hypothetical protein
MIAAVGYLVSNNSSYCHLSETMTRTTTTIWDPAKHLATADQPTAYRFDSLAPIGEATVQIKICNPTHCSYTS